MSLGGIPLLLADTAGLRETADPVEKIGVEAARQRIASAGLVLAVFDSSAPLSEEDRALMAGLQGSRAIGVINKTDLPSAGVCGEIEGYFRHCVYISAAEGQGLPELGSAVAEVLGAVTVCVEDALSALYALTGRRVSEEVVDQVFEQFCVGK